MLQDEIDTVNAAMETIIGTIVIKISTQTRFSFLDIQASKIVYLFQLFQNRMILSLQTADRKFMSG